MINVIWPFLSNCYRNSDVCKCLCTATNCLLALINIVSFLCSFDACFICDFYKRAFFISLIYIKYTNCQDLKKKTSQVSYICVAKGFASILSIMWRDAPAMVLTMLKIIPRGRVRAKSIKPTANVIAKQTQCCDDQHTNERHADIVHVLVMEGGQVLSIIMLRIIFCDWLSFRCS